MLETELVQWLPHPIILAILIPMAITLLLLFPISIFQKTSTSKPNLPPSPPRLPVVGNLHQLSAFPHRSLHSLAQKYGPVMLLRIGQIPTLVISSPELAMEVLKTQDQVFAGRPSQKATNILSYGGRNVTFADYGDHWRQLKKICVVHLLNSKKVLSFRTLREKHVVIMMERIRRSVTDSGGVDLTMAFYGYTNGTIIRGVTGSQSSNSTVASFRERLDEATSLIAGFHIDDEFPSLWWIGLLTGMDRKLRALFGRWDSFLSGVVDGPRKGTDDGFVDVLLSLQKDPAFEHVLPTDVIKAVTLDLSAAATDTSYTVLEWVMSELMTHPELLQRAKLEIAGVSNGKAFVPEEDLNQMPFLKAVIKETLRMHPPAPLLFPHRTLEHATVQGYHVPKNTRVFINAWSLSRDPNWWESPDEFMPDRFMDGGVDYKGQHYQFLPFGSGRRICPGMQFAVVLIELAIANLLYLFDWEMPKGQVVLDMGERPGVTIRRASKLQLAAKPCRTWSGMLPPNLQQCVD